MASPILFSPRARGIENGVSTVSGAGRGSCAEKVHALPSLFRFLATIAILGGLIFAGMFVLATFVEPTPREMTVTIPNAKLQPGNK